MFPFSMSLSRWLSFHGLYFFFFDTVETGKKRLQTNRFFEEIKPFAAKVPNVCTQLQWKIQRRNKKRKTHEQKTRNIQSNLIFFLHWPYNFIIRWASGGVTCSYVQTMANENGCIIRLKIVCLSTEKSLILLFYMVHAKVASLPVHSSEFVFFFYFQDIKNIWLVFLFSIAIQRYTFVECMSYAL